MCCIFNFLYACRYAVTGNEEEWEKAVSGVTTNIVSVKKKKLSVDAVDEGGAVKKKKPGKEKKKHKHQ